MDTVTGDTSADFSRSDLRLPVAGDVIRGTVWTPAAEPAGVVVVHPATATPERFYSTFAEYLASRGLAAVTYDYRGTGRSGDPRRHGHLRMRDWMATDVPAVADWTRSHFPGLPLTAVGHSIGGHALVLGHGTEDLDRFAVVSSHVADTRTVTPRRERLRVAVMLHAVGPALSRALGYMPGKRLGIGEDMPTAAMLEWGGRGLATATTSSTTPPWMRPPAPPPSRRTSWHSAPRTTPGPAPPRCER